MFDLREPKFQWGHRVTALIDLFNDGSHPEVPEGALLVPLGAAGEVLRIGRHEAENLPIYMVEFGVLDGEVLPGARPCVVGVMEEEIAPL